MCFPEVKNVILFKSKLYDFLCHILDLGPLLLVGGLVGFQCTTVKPRSSPNYLSLFFLPGKTDVASLLLQNGADINAQTNGRQTPLHFAASGAGGGTTLQLLLCNRWLDATIRNMQDETAYDIAKRSGKHHELFEIVEDCINVK